MPELDGLLGSRYHHFELRCRGVMTDAEVEEFKRLHERVLISKIKRIAHLETERTDLRAHIVELEGENEALHDSFRMQAERIRELEALDA